jgi:UDPglucose 6-dehydrogenase
MKIGVIGKGFVGTAVYEGLGQIDNEMSYHDPKDGTRLQAIRHTDIVFVCVPTNMNNDGTCDTSIVEQVLTDLYVDISYEGIVVIKSTIIPGTTESFQSQFPFLNICCVPEFLRERSATSDFVLEHDVLIIGCDDYNTAEAVKRAHGSIPKEVAVMSPIEAELAKYFNNVFNAMRITFANGFYSVCEQLGADYQKIYNAMKMRSNIDGHYLRASKTMRGFGGYCLPKDTAAFARMVEDLELPSTIFRSIVEDNRLYKSTVFEGMRE